MKRQLNNVLFWACLTAAFLQSWAGNAVIAMCWLICSLIHMVRGDILDEIEKKRRQRAAEMLPPVRRDQGGQADAEG